MDSNRRQRYFSRVLIGCGVAFSALALMGCAAKKPVNVRWQGVTCSKTYRDISGVERRDCDCKNGKQVALDARTGAAIYRCE